MTKVKVQNKSSLSFNGSKLGVSLPIDHKVVLYRVFQNKLVQCDEVEVKHGFAFTHKLLVD